MHRNEPVKNALLFLMLPVLAVAAPTSLQFIQPGLAVMPISNGATLTYGGSSLVVTDASGNQTASLPATALGAGQSSISAAAIDATDNIWIVGQTTSADFPFVHPLFTTPVQVSPGQINTNAFVAKLSPSLSILFSTFLQGTSPTAQTTATALALDGSGDAYVVGYTDDSTFPVTGANFGPALASTIGFLPISATFITEISVDGSALVYSHLLGGSHPICNGGSACENAPASSGPVAVAVDKSGNLAVVGNTNAADFPVTVKPYPNGVSVFIARIAKGGQMSWSTEVGAIFLGEVGASAQSVLLDSSGNVYIAGNSHGAIAGTPGALQPTYSPESLGVDVSTGFVMKFSPDGTQLLYATNLTGSQGSRIAGMASDSSGNVWVGGFTASPDFPGLSNVPAAGVDFALELNPTGSAITQILGFLPATISTRPSFDSSGRILLLGSTGTALRWNLDPTATTSAIFGLTNSAVPSSMAGGTPGELATFYGVGLGPAQGIVATPDASGNYPTTLGGVRVAFSAGFATFPARLLYVGPNQINFQVPFELSPTTQVIVTTPTGPLPALAFRNLPNIGIFGVINPDGSINSQSNPAPTGSAVAIYATGLGAPEPSSQDGAISTTADNAFLNAVKIQNLLGPSLTLPVLYAGTAPSLINGLDQINVQLPSRQTPEIRIAATNANSNQIYIYTH